MKEFFTPVCSKLSYSCCTLLFFAFSFFTPGLHAADPGKVNDHVIHINGIEKEFTSLQSAVSSAKAGSLVYIPAGIWDEKLVIDKGLLLVPEEGAVIKAVEINAPGEEVTLGGNLNIKDLFEIKEGSLNKSEYEIKAGSYIGYSNDPAQVINTQSSHFGEFIHLSTPSVTCPGNQSRNTDNNVCTYTAVGTEFDYVSATSDCLPITSYNYTLSGATTGSGTNTLAGVVFNKNVTTVTWTVTDNCAFTASCSFTVSVSDTQNPTFSTGCPSNYVANAGASSCSEIASWTDSYRCR